MTITKDFEAYRAARIAREPRLRAWLANSKGMRFSAVEMAENELLRAAPTCGYTKDRGYAIAGVHVQFFPFGPCLELLHRRKHMAELAAREWRAEVERARKARLNRPREAPHAMSLPEETPNPVIRRTRSIARLEARVAQTFYDLAMFYRDRAIAEAIKAGKIPGDG